MDNYDSLPDLKMTALALLFQMKWHCPTVHKSNDFVVKETLAYFASILEDDDIGYFYDPKAPKDLCTNPGELVGKIANSRLPYGFNFGRAVDQFVLMLNSIDEQDYNKIGVVVSDCLVKTDADELMKKVATIEGAKTYVFSIGGCAVTDGIIHLEDALELKEGLNRVGASLGFR